MMTLLNKGAGFIAVEQRVEQVWFTFKYFGIFDHALSPSNSEVVLPIFPETVTE